MADVAPTLPEAAVAQLAAASPVELAAVLLGFGYILLAIRQQRACWVAGGLSTALYIVVFLDARLYLQSLLQVLYVVLAFVGWRQWGRSPSGVGGMVVRRWPVGRHALLMVAVTAASIATATTLSTWSDSAAPWGDALGAWASVAATWLMVRKVAANWLWWIVVDAGLAWLYATQDLAFTAILYAAFAVLAGAGWWSWRSAREVE